MNKISLLWELREAGLHLDSLIGKIESETSTDDMSLPIAVEMGHILNHIVLGWHYRKLKLEEVHALSQQQFEEYARSIPNFGFNLKLLEGLDVEAE